MRFLTQLMIKHKGRKHTSESGARLSPCRTSPITAKIRPVVSRPIQNPLASITWKTLIFSAALLQQRGLFYGWCLHQA